MKKYVMPEIGVLSAPIEDVITTSSTDAELDNLVAADSDWFHLD